MTLDQIHGLLDLVVNGNRAATRSAVVLVKEQLIR
jgi:uncharacterized protein YhfF